MLLGIWKNIDELEESVSLDELKLILDAKREDRLRQMKFEASLQGIDLDKALKKNAEEEFLRVQRKVEARLSGMSEKQFEYNELGFDVEIEGEEE